MNEPSNRPTEMRMRSWEKSLLGVPARGAHTIVPGLLGAVLVALASTWLSRQISALLGYQSTPVSSPMIAILIGLLIGNSVRLPPGLKTGFDFAVRKVLRLGIILLGIRLSIAEVLRLGALGIPIVFTCILGALTFTLLFNRWLKLPERLGMLVAVGTSICGVSAIIAAGPAIEAREEEVTYAVSVITIFGLMATLVYPYLAHTIFAGDAARVGFFLGTSIHDTSQVAGAGLVYAEMYSAPEALNTATVTKLVRNIFMILVLPLISFLYMSKARPDGTDSGWKARIRIHRLLPSFIAGFLFLATVRSVGDLTLNASGNALWVLSSSAWEFLLRAVQETSALLMVVALAGVGLTTRTSLLKNLGIKPFLVGLGAALSVGLVSFGIIQMFGLMVAL